MRSRILKSAQMAAIAAMIVCVGAVARADTVADVRGLYERFVAAQNVGNMEVVRSLLDERPEFLWVTDGMAVWGRDAAIARMRLFQKSEIWRVEPELGKARTIELGADAAVFHLPLTLVIGSSAPGPNHLRFLVEIVCRRTDGAWRIAALLTTTEKPG